MVDIITQQTRSQAQQQSRQLESQQAQLRQQQQSLQAQGRIAFTAQQVRELPLLGRQQIQRSRASQIEQNLRKLKSQQAQISTQQTQLKRILSLPTRQQALKSFNDRFKVARKIALKPNIPLKNIDPQFREIAQEIREGFSRASIIARFEKALQQSLPADIRETLVTQFREGTVPTFTPISIPKVPRFQVPTLLEIKFQQTLLPEFRNLSISQIPTQLEAQLKQSIPQARTIKFTPQDLGKIRSFISKTKEGVKIKEKQFSDFLKSKGLTDKNIRKFSSKIFETLPAFQKIVVEPKEKLPFIPFISIGGLKGEEILEGGIIGLRDEPVKTGLTLAAFVALPSVTRGVSALGKLTKITPALSKLTPEVVKKIGKFALTKGLLATYLGATGLQIVGAEGGARGKGLLIGRKITTEVLPFMVGGRLGVKGDLKLQLKQEFNKEIAKLPTNKKAAFEEYIKQSELLGRFNPTVKNVKFDQVENIPEKAIPSIRKFFRENNIAIGGSAAQTSQVKLDRKAGDIDAYVPEGKDPKVLIKQLRDILTAKGVERVSIGGGGRVLTINGKKAIDFNNLERLLNNIGEVTPFYVPAKNYLVRTPEGILVQRIGVQLKRKAVAGFLDPKRIATGKFKKDLKDFKKISDQLFKRAELSARQSFFFREGKIRELEKTFGVRISRKPVGIGTFKKPQIISKLPKKAISKVGRVLGEGKPLKKISVNGLKRFKESKLISADKFRVGKKPFTPSKIKPSQPPKKLKSTSFLPSQISKSQKPFRPSQPIRPSQPSKKPFTPSQPIKTTTTTKLPFVPTPSQLTSQPPKSPPSQPPKGPPSKPPFGPPTRKKGNRKAEKIRIAAVLKKFGASKVRPLGKPKAGTPGYNAFVKSRGKFFKANVVPLTKRKAQDLASFVTDKSLSAKWRIKKTNRLARKPVRIVPSNYFLRNQNKYRPFKRKKGKKIPIKNAAIERRKFRLDSFSEVKKIQAERFAKGLSRRLFKPVKPLIQRRKK